MSKELKPWEKIDKLEQSVMQDSADDVVALYDALGKVPFTAQALGLACRYRGLETVKVLAERGAAFTFDLAELKPVHLGRSRYFWLELYDDENYSFGLLSDVKRRETYELNNIGKMHCGVSLVSLSERLKTLDYLLENAEKLGFKADEFLFYAYLSDEREMIDFLKSKGVRASERLLKIITEGANNDDWLNYCYIVGNLPDDKFFRVMGAIVEECAEQMPGRKLHFTEKLWEYNERRFVEKPEFLKFLLLHFNQAKINKTKLMKKIIDRDNVPCLEIAAENGLLKQPRKRDEMIDYANEKNAVECTAWLLDFKNRTADLAAERAKAEKKLERELNANPNSASELRKVWSFKKRGDGTLEITNYRGNSTKIIVPAKIGKSAVTAIGKEAFSPFRDRVCHGREFFRTITEITLPDGIVEIGEMAFDNCLALTAVVVPKSVSVIGKAAFANCKGLTVTVERGSYAEEYCKENGVKFKDK